MDKSKGIIIAIVVVVALVIAFIVSNLKKSQYSKMLSAIKQQNYKEFNELVDSKLSSFLYSSLFLDSLRLEVAYLKNDRKKINELLDKMLKQKLTETQKNQIVSKAFNYYVASEDKSNAHKYIEIIRTSKNQRMIQECERVYDVYIEKGSLYLDEVLEETEMLDEENRGVNEYLISLMYRNKGDNANAEKYQKLSKEHLAAFDKKHNHG